jgi:RNA polymerase sigma factor (sigma-70 family)
MAGTAFGTAYRHLRDLFGAKSVIGLGDGQLLSRYSGSKDELAFEALVARHGPMVLATCRAILKNEHDVEDAFQATFLILARSAGAIRGADALGGWLHRVACRASVQASVEAKKRRRREAEASAMAVSDANHSGLGTDHDVRPILHEEIDRLPKVQRLPIVLCYLEGLTYEEAAERLRWTVPALRCRLLQARQRLKSRLIRRGVDAPAAGAILVPRRGSAAVPAGLSRSTVLAAIGGPASPGAALLTHTLLRGMMMYQIKIATMALLAAVGLASAGWIAANAGGPEAPPPAPTTQPKAEAVGREEPVSGKPLETVEVKGRVVAPDGRSVAGAAVAAAYFRADVAAWPRATSGTDGSFTIRLPRQDGADSDGYRARFPWVVASAPGHGVGWIQGALRPDRRDDLVVRLPEEGPPIEGQVVDLEGRPVAGARVEAARIWFDGNGDLAGWIAKARNGAAGNLWQGLENLSLEPFAAPGRASSTERLVSISATTGADGRFTLTGIGRDRIADLIVSGPGIATTQVHAFSRPEPEIRTVDRGMMRREPFIVHAPRFQLALPPSKRVEGAVRDKDSGTPIAGLGIRAAVFDPSSLIPSQGIEARTDAEGRYRLDGLPLAAAYRLFVTPDKGLPYLNGTFKAPGDSRGLEPVTFDFALKRGVLVRGRVTDKATGKPIRGYGNYYTFEDNPTVRDYPGFSSSYVQSAYFDEAGRYEVVALPGRGIIAVRDELDRYRPASGYETIAGYDAKRRWFNTLPFNLHPNGHAIVAEIIVDPKAESTTLDLQADPGRSVPCEVVDPDGAPLGDTKVKGQKELFQTGPMPQASSRFMVYALDPSEPRRVVVMHEGRKLIGTAFLKGNEVGPIVIKLQPWGSVAGRIVDDEGRPRKGMFISSPGGSTNKHPETHDILPGSDWNQGVRVGDDGRFLVEGLVPGLKYGATARAGFEAFGGLFVDVTVAAGEAKDLGDLKVQPPKKTEED